MSIDRERLKRTLTGAGAVLAVLAAVKIAIHLLTASGWGYFIDELYYLAMQPHLDFGYADIPPGVPALMAVSNRLFGTSLTALHIFPAIAGALTLVVVGLIARELGGGRFAQVLAGLTILVSPVWLAIDSWFAYDAFDQLVTAILFWAWIRLMKEPSPRRWLIVGLVLGIGLLTKMSVLFTWPALALALLATSQRRSLLTPWPWLAAALALAVASPFIVWQGLHGWPIVTYWLNYGLYHPHPSFEEFLAQVLVAANVAVMPLAVLGLIYFGADAEGKRYRTVAIVFGVLAALFLALRAEPRLLTSAFLPLIAGGAVFCERLLAAGAWRPRLKPAYMGLLAVAGIVFGASGLPVGDPSIWPRDAGGDILLPDYLYLRLGWPELAGQVAEVYQQLPPEDQARTVIYTSNYGEAAAIDFFGPQYGLPPAISNHNAFQVWGPGDRPADVAIVVGGRFSPYADIPRAINLSRLWANVTWAGQIIGPSGGPYWERGVPIFICREPIANLRDVWPELAGYY